MVGFNGSAMLAQHMKSQELKVVQESIQVEKLPITLVPLENDPFEIP